jgi:hypothetical protein
MHSCTQQDSNPGISSSCPVSRGRCDWLARIINRFLFATFFFPRSDFRLASENNLSVPVSRALCILVWYRRENWVPALRSLKQHQQLRIFKSPRYHGGQYLHVPKIHKGTAIIWNPAKCPSVSTVCYLLLICRRPKVAQITKLLIEKIYLFLLILWHCFKYAGYVESDSKLCVVYLTTLTVTQTIPW